MELFSLIINLAAELAKLARTLLTDGIRFMALLARSRTALAAENLISPKTTRLLPGTQHQTATLRQRHAVYAGAAFTRFRMARCTGKCHAKDFHRLAWRRISPVLALEITARPATNTGRTARAHS